MRPGVGGINYFTRTGYRIPKLPRQRAIVCVQDHEEERRVRIIHIGSFDLHIQFTYYSVPAGSAPNTTTRSYGKLNILWAVILLDGRIISHQNRREMIASEFSHKQ